MELPNELTNAWNQQMHVCNLKTSFNLFKEIIIIKHTISTVNNIPTLFNLIYIYCVLHAHATLHKLVLHYTQRM